MEKTTKRRITPVTVEIAPENEKLNEPALEPKTPELETVEPPKAKKEEIKKEPEFIDQIDQSSASQKRGFNFGFLFIILTVSVLTLFLSGGLYVYFNGNSSSSTPEPFAQSEEPEVLSIPEATPTPTPEPKIDLSTYSVNVLNGSGKIGEAGKAKALLEKAGFKVSKTENARSFDFEETVIQAKEGVSFQAIKAVKEALLDTYKVTEGETLDSKATADLIITVGSK